MQKIPTFLERDWDGDRSRVLNQVTPGCEWVTNGEGVATRKYDGTCCMIDVWGVFWKRHEVKLGKAAPLDFVLEQEDETTGKRIGWVHVGDGPEDKWHRQAYDLLNMSSSAAPRAGTYELLGPKIQGNPEGFRDHILLYHDDAEVLDGAPRDFDVLAEYFKDNDIEGIVWHHPDGRMAKIKARDFGIKRAKKTPVPA